MQRTHDLDLPADESQALALCHDLLTPSGLVTDEVYAEAVETLGTRGVFEVVTVVGFYRTLGSVINTFHVPVPDGHPEPF